MEKPYLEPLGGDEFKLSYPRQYVRSEDVRRGDPIAKLEAAQEKYPYNFGTANLLSEAYTAAGEFEKACNVRFHAVQRFMELMPDDDREVSLDWDQKDNRPVIELLRGSGIDHFLAGDWELAAGLFETALELDSDDHLDITPTLAFCYVALREEELFCLTMQDITEKEMARPLLRLWGAYNFREETIPVMSAELRENKILYDEFTADTHPVTPQYLADIESERPSSEARARLLWLQTEHLWEKFPEFLSFLKDKKDS